MLALLSGVVIGLLGLGVLAGGLWLLIAGGSPSYLAMGIGLLVSGVLLMQRRAWGFGVYALTLAGTLAWAVWEVGLDRWALVPRVALLAVIGLWLVAPWTSWGLRRPVPRGVAPAEGEPPVPMPDATAAADPPARVPRLPRIALAMVLVATVITAVASLFGDDADLARQDDARVALSAPASAASVAMPDVAAHAPAPAADDWPAWGGNNHGQRHSRLSELTPDNVDDLEVAWTYHTGDLKRDGDPKEVTFEATPLKVGDTLYLCTPHSIVIALDATTGEERWRHDPDVEATQRFEHATCRGVAYADLAAATPWPAPQAVVSTRPVASPPAEAPASASAGGDAAGAPVGAEASPATMAPGTTADMLAAAQAALPPPAGAASAASAPPMALAIDHGADAEPAAPAPPPACPQRVLVGTLDGRLLALDAHTGVPCEGFGDNGAVDLTAQMPNMVHGAYMQTSPPLVVRGRVIVGGAIGDNVSVANPSGVIRAYDLRSGALLWKFDPGLPDDETAPLPEGDTYTAGAPNSWSVSSADEALGLVYVPFGNQSPDQYGAGRSEAVERHSSSITALDVDTGQPRWVRQTVHHDLWDMDVPAQPTLVDLTVDGQRVPALVGPTKQGDVYVLNRATGEPLLDVTENPAPQGAAPGDETAPTQPTSALNFVPPPLRERDMWGVTPLDQLWCRVRFHRLRYEGRYTPPSLEGSLVYPGNTGIFNWGSVAVDPDRQVMVGTPLRLAFVQQLVPRPDDTANVVTDGEAPFGENKGARYAAKMAPFVSPLQLPCQQPPWGLIASADLRTGQLLWQHRNGTVRDELPDWLPLPLRTGVPGLGGPLITAGGLVFYSGTVDNYLRAYDLHTGDELWRGRLPAGGQATPMTYTDAAGRQVVLVAAGGHGSLGTDLGDAVVAYRLPSE